MTATLEPTSYLDLDVFFGYQQRWCLDESKLKVAVKGRRVGLTWCEAADAVLLAALDKSEGGCDVMYISTREDLAQEFIETCSEWALNFDIYPDIPPNEGVFQEVKYKGKKREILSSKITFASGNSIIALSSKPSNMRGLEGRVIIDEAAFHEKLKELIKAAIACTMWVGDVRIISTHNGLDNEFNLLVEDIEAGKYSKDVSLHIIPLDLAVREGLYRRICLTHGIPWTEENEKAWVDSLEDLYKENAAEELYCIPKSGLESYFTLELLSSVQIECPILLYYQTPEFFKKPQHEQILETQNWLLSTVKPKIDELILYNYKTWIGVDFGRTNDLTVISPVIKPYGQAAFTPFLVELRNVPFKCQEEICKYITKSMKKVRKSAYDAGGNGASLAEAMVLEFGEDRVMAIKFATKDLIEIFTKYKGALESELFFIPDDKVIQSDHFGITLQNGVPKGNYNNARDQSVTKRHCDGAYSLALAWHCVDDAGLLPRPKLPLTMNSGANYWATA